MEVKQKNTSDPPGGYVCKLCQVEGHWIQQCPDKKKKNNKQKKSKKSNHIPVPGVDPSQQDIEKAKELQN